MSLVFCVIYFWLIPVPHRQSFSLINPVIQFKNRISNDTYNATINIYDINNQINNINVCEETIKKFTL